MDAPRFRILPPVAFGAPFAAGWAVTRWLGDPWRIPGPARAGGLMLLLVAALAQSYTLWFMHHARTTFLPGRPTTTILTTGPFAVTRNPLYLGLAALHLGGALAIPSLWALVGLPVAILAVAWGAILPEERYLRSKFGEGYEAYARRVRRWL